MKLQPQTTEVTVVTKRNITTRFALNIYGIVLVLGLLLSIYTTTFSFEASLGFYQSEERLMEPKKMKEYIIFIVSTGIVYFLAVNLYFIRRNSIKG
ncbi:hypothetical protein [Metabacillus malikii]|uniref:Prolipoprotein diacylglyceryltransferase n=1 Tax=Metabacillus malikii TaxID=1504265 RepID=A0ABT9ZI83_9BACI|nr:hypothetical protein [Metabacillus malikii]MDQ0231989.1 prolipoprotein diacylglyceryltransferase [Metabacillus malikii]